MVQRSLITVLFYAFLAFVSVAVKNVERRSKDLQMNEI
jgi:hypothetical protein